MKKSQNGRTRHLHVAPDDFPGPIDVPGSAIPPISVKDRNRALSKENDELKAALGLNGSVTLESWAENTPQELRDQFAASALIAEGLHPQRALARLGFNLETSEERKEIAQQIFSSPGVQAILRDDAKKFAGKKDTVLAEMYAIVRTGDPDQKIRAAGQLAKMLDGWQDGEKVKGVGNTVNLLMQMVGGASANGTPRVVGNATVAELPPGEEIIDADDLLVDRGDEVATVVDDAT